MENSKSSTFSSVCGVFPLKGCVKISFYASRYGLTSTRIFCTKNKIPSDETLKFTRLVENTFGEELERMIKYIKNLEKISIPDDRVFYVSNNVPYKSDKNYEDNMY